MSRKLLFAGFLFSLALACKSSGGGGGGDTVVTPSTYVATGGEGDLVVWTVADGGGDVTAVVTAVDQRGNPIDGGEFTIRGACGSRNATFDYRTCTISSVTPTRAGGKSPKTGDQYYTLELPGVAFLAHPAGADGGGKRHDLHVGLIRGTCGDLSGTYNMVHVGPPGFLLDTFGQFVLTSNSSGVVSGVTHWDYGYVVNGQYSTNSGNDPIKVALTSDETTLPLVDGGSSCSNGVAIITMPGPDGNEQIRANLTQQGALLIDLQRGNGGVVGIKAAAAATLADIKNRTFFLLLYQGNDEIEIMRVQVDGDAGAMIVASTDPSSNIDGGQSGGRFVALSDSSLSSYFGASGIVDSKNPVMGADGGSGGGEQFYGGLTTAHAAAPVPATFPGFFALVGSQGSPWDENGRMVVVMVQKADAGLFLTGGHLAVNNPNSGTNSDGGFTRCFDFPVDAGYQNEGMRNDRQWYCVDGPFVGYSR